MIGPYSQFKGKLKAGDRVRVEYGGRTSLGEVNETSESGFTVRENMDEWRCVERFIFWTSEGTLELLTPSPRVVTDAEETSLPLIAKFPVKAHGTVEYKNITSVANPTDKDVYVTIYGQPASPPAPAEKEEEWWNDPSYKLHKYSCGGLLLPNMPAIVAEAKRMGAEEAWREMRELLPNEDHGACDEGDTYAENALNEYRAATLTRIDAKLESLNKPAGAGEN